VRWAPIFSQFLTGQGHGNFAEAVWKLRLSSRLCSDYEATPDDDGVDFLLAPTVESPQKMMVDGDGCAGSNCGGGSGSGSAMFMPHSCAASRLNNGLVNQLLSCAWSKMMNDIMTNTLHSQTQNTNFKKGGQPATPPTARDTLLLLQRREQTKLLWRERKLHLLMAGPAATQARCMPRHRTTTPPSLHTLQPICRRPHTPQQQRQQWRQE
jgi:hypothetical protein